MKMLNYTNRIRQNLIIPSGVLYFIIFFLYFSDIAYSSDPFLRVEANNSYKKFERCMQANDNDITLCLESFNETTNFHKKVLKNDPNNEEVKNTLLQLVNSLNDIAETFYSAAEGKKGINPAIAQKYYSKASDCYKLLSLLYPKKQEFFDLLDSANFNAQYSKVELYAFELKNINQIQNSLQNLRNLKISFDEFVFLYAKDESLNKLVDDIVTNFEKKVNLTFQKTIERKRPADMKFLTYLLKCQFHILELYKKNQFQDHLHRMEGELVQFINNNVDSYKVAMKNADNEYNNGNYYEAKKLYLELAKRTEYFPDLHSISSNFQFQLTKTIKDFNINHFKSIINQQVQLATNTTIFLDMISKGENLFKAGDWLNSYNTYMEATEFFKKNTIATKTNNLPKLLNNVQKKIDSLDPNEIESLDLAEFRFKPISYNQWLENAKNGNFLKDYVFLTGSCQQMINDIVILKNPTIEYDFFLENFFIGTEMNSTGLVFPQKRFFKVDSYITCIGKFHDLGEFSTVMGTEFQIPLFNVIWIEQ